MARSGSSCLLSDANKMLKLAVLGRSEGDDTYGVARSLIRWLWIIMVANSGRLISVLWSCTGRKELFKLDGEQKLMTFGRLANLERSFGDFPPPSAGFLRGDLVLTMKVRFNYTTSSVKAKWCNCYSKVLGSNFRRRRGRAFFCSSKSIDC